MSFLYINDTDFVEAEKWIEENRPGNGVFRVYWKDVRKLPELGRSSYDGGATLDPAESNCKIHTDCSGHLRFEWYYKDGKRADGVSKGFWPDGQLKHIWNWKNGKVHGLYTALYQDGQKRKEQTFKNGKEDGFVTYWSPDGKESSEMIYKDGRSWNGLYIKWHENGNKWMETPWKDGKKDGLHTRWWPSGQKMSEETLKDGEMISDKCWNENGNETDCRLIRYPGFAKKNWDQLQSIKFDTK